MIFANDATVLAVVVVQFFAFVRDGDVTGFHYFETRKFCVQHTVTLGC